MKKETNFKLLFPCLSTSLDIKAELSIVEDDGVVQSFSTTFTGSHQGSLIGKFDVEGIKDCENRYGGTMEMKQTAYIPSYILEKDEPSSEFLKSIHEVETSCCDLLSERTPIFYSNIIAALVYLPEMERDVIVAFQLMQKLGSCISIGLGYVLTMNTSPDSVESNFDGVIEVLVDNFESENKSILSI